MTADVPLGIPTVTVRCGELYCNRCGDCIACYGNQPCGAGGWHDWDGGDGGVMTPRKQTGDPIELGDEVSFLDDDIRIARVVGLRKDDCRPIEQIILRWFRDGDDAFPTGEYRTTSGIGMVPYRGSAP